MKPEIPATIPASIVSAKAGLAAISAKIVPPAGTDLYDEFVNDEPMTNSIGIATISPTDHVPNVVLGVILQGCFIMPSSFHSRRPYNHPILHSCNLCNPGFPHRRKLLSPTLLHQRQAPLAARLRETTLATEPPESALRRRFRRCDSAVGWSDAQGALLPPSPLSRVLPNGWRLTCAAAQARNLRARPRQQDQPTS
jgi:hypothetical protein